MIQGDTRQLLLPLLPEALHPAIRRLGELIRSEEDAWKKETAITPAAPPPGRATLRPLELIEMERWSPEPVLLDSETPGHKPSLPGWDVLRALGGEISEVVAFAASEEVTPEEPLLLAGRFERGGMFQASLVPNRPEARWRLAVVTRYDRAELVFPQGWPGPARLTWRDKNGELREETWETWNPWPVLVEVLENALARPQGPAPWIATGAPSEPITRTPSARHPVIASPRPLTWQDAIRCLELDDAARRSVMRRRASTLEYQEATEEAGFKGTMTLVGCGLLWGSLVLLILSRWLPWLGWAIAPVFAVFLLLQLLRWLVPGGKNPEVAKGTGVTQAPPKTGP